MIYDYAHLVYLQAPYQWTETSILPENAGDTYRQIEAAQYNGRGGAVYWFPSIDLSLELHFAQRKLPRRLIGFRIVQARYALLAQPLRLQLLVHPDP